VRVRIKRTPKEKEIDGVCLTGMLTGTVRDVSPELAMWLIAEEYADFEMRQSGGRDDQFDGFFTADRSSLRPRERRLQKR
jgi:hypothetical protein